MKWSRSAYVLKCNSTVGCLESVRATSSAQSSSNPSFLSAWSTSLTNTLSSERVNSFGTSQNGVPEPYPLYGPSMRISSVKSSTYEHEIPSGQIYTWGKLSASCCKRWALCALFSKSQYWVFSRPILESPIHVDSDTCASNKSGRAINKSPNHLTFNLLG